MANIKNLNFKESDDFKREPIAKNIYNLLTSEVDVSPLVIDGDWGTGKTEFTHRLIKLIENKQTATKDSAVYKTIYIDAFKADHADEPLMTILASIIKSTSDNKHKSELRKKAISALKFGTKTILKAGVSWALRQDATDIANDFDKEIKGVLDKTIGSILNVHEKADENIVALQKVLKDIVSSTPLIIFIDELDRCRPDFAIKMLENIKHIFDIKKLQFVLVANTNQIKASINHCYGSDVNAQNYLDKFLGFSFVLPKSYLGSQFSNSQNKFKIDFKLSKILSNAISNSVAYQNFILNLIKTNCLTLRQVETYIKYLEIYQIISSNELSKDDSEYLMILKLFGIFIFCFKPDSTNDLDNGIVDVIKLSKILGKNKLFAISDNDFAKGRISNEDIIVTNIFCKATKNRSTFGSFEDNQEKLWGYRIKSNSINLITNSINRLKLGEVNPV